MLQLITQQENKMSRTYRRRSTTRNGMWSDLEYYTSEWVYPWKEFGLYSSYRIPFEKGSTEYKKGKAKFHSDAGTTSFKEPGPSWFRRIFKRKYKAKVRAELNKFLINPEYEVDLHFHTEKYKLDYWT